MKFSPSLQSFYPDNVDYTNLPTDLVEVSDTDYVSAVHRPTGSTVSVADSGALIINPPVADPKFQSFAPTLPTPPESL